jgi:hypothetical protein
MKKGIMFQREKKRKILISIPESMIERLDRIAELNDVSRTFVILELLDIAFAIAEGNPKRGRK